jgi:hypothetical protein
MLGRKLCGNCNGKENYTEISNARVDNGKGKGGPRNVREC